VEFPHKLYQTCPQWVPLPLSDGLAQLNWKNAYFQHSDADFFIAENDERMLGRIAVLQNNRYNQAHQTRRAFFYLFDTINDIEVAQRLFEAATEWSFARGLDTLVGPKGFSPFDGVGMLVKGFEHHPAMGMPYNYEYYNHLMTQLGFEKEIDFTSFYLNIANFDLPDRISRIAERVKRRNNLRVKTFRSRRELRRWIPRLVETYNQIFVDNWEYAPVTPAETKELAGRMLQIVQPKHIKFILNDQEDLVGFVLTFLDISAALQKTGGKLFPFGWITLLRGLRNTNWININGMGILEQYRGLGANAILYDEVAKTIRQGRFEHADLVQMADTVDTMLADMQTIGAEPYKVHRIYRRSI
jgi:hypothetical protein